MDEVYQEHRDQLQPLKDQREKMVKAQRQERRDLRKQQEARQAEEGAARHARFRKGLMGLVDFVTGRARAIRKENEADLERCTARDSAERQELVEAQMAERKTLQAKIAKMMAVHSKDRTELAKEVIHYMRIAERSVDDRLERMIDRTNEHDLSTGRGRDRSRNRTR